VTAAAMNAAQVAAQVAAGGAVNAGSVLLGIGLNQFVTLLFVGPKYKRFEFQWAVAPHSQLESDTLRRIANVFKNAMAPKMALQGGIWKFPKLFKIGFFPNSKFMYKFKPSVLETFSANYTPSGRASFLRSDNPAAGENAPSTMVFRARFIETEFWTAGNYNDSNDPDDTYTKEP
jgi:hypothetical protein